LGVFRVADLGGHTGGGGLRWCQGWAKVGGNGKRGGGPDGKASNKKSVNKKQM
jgi:hypothetical protein